MRTTTGAFACAAIVGFAIQGAFALPASQNKNSARAAGVVTSCTVPNTAAITFDDGPYTWNRDIVNTLDAAGAKGTFFVNGNNYGCIFSGSNPSNVKYAYSQGHQIASHTWSHPHLPSLSANQITTEFSKTNDAIKKITGAIPAFVRPPYGEYDQDVLNVAESMGQTVVTWDFDSGDSAGVSAAQSATAYQKLVDSHPNNILTLNHETHSSTANDLLPKMIQILQGAGYNLVTVAECLGMDPYLSTGGPTGSGSC
ncbi:carbohydrate esterase family 4 protein [Ceratobasidium sp. AG-I]|nr:carbohydrate esterase family 4 protein [Ceratobasidium sp. AG-I]